jgi:hypothetical protein
MHLLLAAHFAHPAAKVALPLLLFFAVLLLSLFPLALLFSPGARTGLEACLHQLLLLLLFQPVFIQLDNVSKNEKLRQQTYVSIGYVDERESRLLGSFFSTICCGLFLPRLLQVAL